MCTSSSSSSSCWILFCVLPNNTDDIDGTHINQVRCRFESSARAATYLLRGHARHTPPSVRFISGEHTSDRLSISNVRANKYISRVLLADSRWLDFRNEIVNGDVWVYNSRTAILRVVSLQTFRLYILGIDHQGSLSQCVCVCV